MFYNAKNGSINIDETTMDYISFGKGSKNLIILPGLGDGIKTVRGMAVPFALMYKFFVKDYTVYMFSRKNVLPDKYSSRKMAEDTKKAMDILNIEKTDVWAVSQGGTIAQYLAIDYPERVNKLLLTVTYSKPNSIIDSAVGSWIKYANANNYAAIFTDTAEKSYSENYLKKYRKLYPILSRFGKPKNYDRFITMAEACLVHDSYDELDKIKCPTLIIGGSDDKIVGVQASYEMAERIRNSQIFIYDGLGHGLYEEAPDFNKRIMDFFAQNNY